MYIVKNKKIFPLIFFIGVSLLYVPFTLAQDDQSPIIRSSISLDTESPLFIKGVDVSAYLNRAIENVLASHDVLYMESADVIFERIFNLTLTEVRTQEPTLTEKDLSYITYTMQPILRSIVQALQRQAQQARATSSFSPVINPLETVLSQMQGGGTTSTLGQQIEQQTAILSIEQEIQRVNKLLSLVEQYEKLGAFQDTLDLLGINLLRGSTVSVQEEFVTQQELMNLAKELKLEIQQDVEAEIQALELSTLAVLGDQEAALAATVLLQQKQEERVQQRTTSIIAEEPAVQYPEASGPLYQSVRAAKVIDYYVDGGEPIARVLWIDGTVYYLRNETIFANGWQVESIENGTIQLSNGGYNYRLNF